MFQSGPTSIPSGPTAAVFACSSGKGNRAKYPAKQSPAISRPKKPFAAHSGQNKNQAFVAVGLSPASSPLSTIGGSVLIGPGVEFRRRPRLHLGGAAASWWQPPDLFGGG